MAGIASSSSWCTVLYNNNNIHKLGNAQLSRQRCGVNVTYCCNKNNQEQESEECCGIRQENGTAKRRQVLVGMTTSLAVAAVSIPPFIYISDASADSDTDTGVPQGFRIYTDDDNKFKIFIPAGWRVGVGEGEPNGFKSVTAFYPEETTTSNVSVIITGLGPDFTKIESFGKVDEFAETLVSGLDRSWQRPPGVAAKLINSKSKDGFYYIDYTLQNPGESRKYLFSLLGMASNGWYNRLYTVTGQFEEGDSAKYGSVIEKAVASFRFI